MAEGVGREFETYRLKLLASICVWTRPVALIALLMLASAKVAGQFAPLDLPRSDYWIPDGAVHAILETNGVIFLGGEFTSLSPNAPTTALLNAVNGLSDVTFPAVNGVIHSAIPDNSGGWYLGGLFNRVGSQARTNLAHIFADNSVDAQWNPSPNDVVHDAM